MLALIYIEENGVPKIVQAVISPEILVSLEDVKENDQLIQFFPFFKPFPPSCLKKQMLYSVEENNQDNFYNYLNSVFTRAKIKHPLFLMI